MSTLRDPTQYISTVILAAIAYSSGLIEIAADYLKQELDSVDDDNIGTVKILIFVSILVFIFTFVLIVKIIYPFIVGRLRRSSDKSYNEGFRAGQTKGYKKGFEEARVEFSLRKEYQEVVKELEDFETKLKDMGIDDTTEFVKMFKMHPYSWAKFLQNAHNQNGNNELWGVLSKALLATYIDSLADLRGSNDYKL